MRRRVSIGVVLLLFLFTGSAHAAPVLLNGSFELGPAPFSNQDIDIAPGSTAIDGWTASSEIVD